MRTGARSWVAMFACVAASSCSSGTDAASPGTQSPDAALDAPVEALVDSPSGDASDAGDLGDATDGGASDVVVESATPWGPKSCTDGTPSDLPGLTALCSGTLEKRSLVYGSSPTTLGPSAYTFDFVFGADWPGALGGYEIVFPLPPDRYVAIPFKPSALASTSLQLQFYRPEGKLGRFMTISTAPGLFNDGKPNGTTVLCASGTDPNMDVSTDGTPDTCALDPDTVYWLNIAPNCMLSSCGVGLTQAPVFNEACVDGMTGDLPGYTAVCAGSMTLYTPIKTPLGPSPYTFDFVFGAPWPGARSGLSVQFNLGAKQFLAIPFRPDPMFGLKVSMVDTYMGGGKYQLTQSISTSPGLFDPSSPGVLDSRSQYPTTVMSSSGATPVQVKLDPSKVYWLNFVVGMFYQGAWNGCDEPQCLLAFSHWASF